MAIISFTNYKRGQTTGGMSAVMRYTMQGKKTQFEGRQLVTGINCQPKSAYADFMTTKRLCHKTDGVLFYHMVQSFPKSEVVDPVTAHAAALKLAEYYEGCEVLVCTHTDRAHIHSHFLINSVNFDSGKKLHIAQEQLQELRQRNDQVCSEFSLPVFQPREQKRKSKTMTTTEYHTAVRGQSKKLQLMNLINNGFPYTRFFIDGRYSGANFNRPAFEEMVEDVENGRVAVMITKGLSRLGRNQLHTGLYIEEIFPSYDVLCIVINDNVNTLYETSNELIPFKNLFNEWHVCDSSRKARAVFTAKAQRGVRLGTRAPYGYRKNEIKDGPLVVDEDAAQVVRRIFAMCASGLGPSQIARQLKEEKVFSPPMYAYTKYGISHSGLNSERPYNWTSDMVADMLMNMVYLGHTVNMRYSTKSYKDKKKRERPKSDWLIFENTHEPLVDQETWDIVQEVRSHKRRRTNMDEQNMFSGLVYCADCGKSMVLHRAHTMKPEQNNFTCRTYKKDGAEVCTAHYIREVALKKIVLETIRRTAEFARSHPEKFAEYIQQKQSSEVAKEIKAAERELSAMRKRDAELDTVFKRMYEDSALGRVSNEQFRLLSEAYSKEKAQLPETIPASIERLEKLRSSMANTKNFIAKAKKFTDMTELMPELLRAFVSKIIVHEKEVKYSKHAPQVVRIRFRDFDLNEADDPFFTETTEKADSADALSA